MADENAKQVLVYTYDTTDRLHPFAGAISVAEGTALTDGQTDVAPADNNQFWNGSKWVGGDQLVTAYHYDANGYWDGSVLILEARHWKPTKQRSYHMTPTAPVCISLSLTRLKTSGLKRSAKRRSTRSTSQLQLSQLLSNR
ncbi:hypothetical protein LX03_03085 [Limosilactobacillus mucosae]|uniref:Uncharacterized protein n=1 Tax=Limosilactobacillus mucosae TaxID=97478 RepID=A0A099YAC9_LIMMU|nr:hypothetical protein LX03_03085 [Limosilactobacillus mucosae]